MVPISFSLLSASLITGERAQNSGKKPTAQQFSAYWAIKAMEEERHLLFPMNIKYPI